MVLTVFLDLLGFAMFIPDLQLRGQLLATQFLHMDNKALQVGLLIGLGQSVYSIAQLLTGTWLGRLSDTNGRRIVLLISSALSVFAYILYANAHSIFLLYLSRALSGVAAANLGVAFAYVADVSKPEERSAKMGMLGAAFGAGFVIGPALGAGLLAMNHDSPALLGYFAAALSFVNFILIYRLVKESNFDRLDSHRGSLIGNISHAASVKGLGIVMLMFFMMNLAFTNLETTFFRLLEAKNWIFQIPSDQVKTVGAIILTVVGITGVFTQGGLVRVIVPKLGELKTVRFFYSMFIPVFLCIPYFQFYWPGIIGVIMLGVTNGLSGPSMNALVSQRAPREMQGSIMGLTQSLGSLARVIGPVFANFLFQMRPSYPYLYGAGLACIPAILSWAILKPVPQDKDEVAFANVH
ncbi:MAG: MFS transporter [Armatimonadetes bacterium]|nr:MFS transporter [Armatimonadota bacterium]